MIGMDLIGQIWRAHFEQGRPIEEIVRTLSVSRATIRKVIRGQETPAFRYTAGLRNRRPSRDRGSRIWTRSWRLKPSCRGVNVVRRSGCSRRCGVAAMTARTTACTGISIGDSALETIVIETLAERILQPERLKVVLSDLLDQSIPATQERRAHLTALKTGRTRVRAAIQNMFDFIEQGVVSARDVDFANRLA